MAIFAIGTVGWALGSVLWAELVRDCYHALSHHWPWLYRHHVWHHRVFRRDLTFASAEVYRQAQWKNDFPECLVMLSLSLGLWWVCTRVTPVYSWSALAGTLYTLTFLASCVARASGSEWMRQATDLTHMPGPFKAPPSNGWVNRSYHWRHHFDNDRAYYCSTFALVDKLMGTALSLKGKTVAVTGASGTLGRSLLKYLHLAGAKVIALTSQSDPIAIEVDGQPQTIKTVTWQVGQESALVETLAATDILVLNHGINVGAARTPEAIAQSYEINTFSSWRLLERFLSTVQTNADMALKEVWVNTSEAEVSPAFSPLYELSKRSLGDLVTLRRLDPPCVIRKLILGPFKSNLNPIGVMSGDRVARKIVTLAQRDSRNIVVTVNPLTYLLFPLKEWSVSLYFRLVSRRADPEVSAHASEWQVSSKS
jgi:hypothetical protein